MHAVQTLGAARGARSVPPLQHGDCVGTLSGLTSLHRQWPTSRYMLGSVCQRSLQAMTIHCTARVQSMCWLRTLSVQ